MAITMRELGIDRLPLEERLALVQEIWDSIAGAPEAVELTSAQRDELEARLVSFQNDPRAGDPWDVVKARILARSAVYCWE